MHVIYLEDAHNTGKNNIQQKPCNIAKKVFYSLQVFMVCFLSGFLKFVAGIKQTEYMSIPNALHNNSTTMNFKHKNNKKKPVMESKRFNQTSSRAIGHRRIRLIMKVSFPIGGKLAISIAPGKLMEMQLTCNSFSRI